MGEFSHLTVLSALERTVNHDLDPSDPEHGPMPADAPPENRIQSVEVIGQLSGEPFFIVGGKLEDTPVLRVTMGDGKVYELIVMEPGWRNR